MNQNMKNASNVMNAMSTAFKRIGTETTKIIGATSIVVLAACSSGDGGVVPPVVAAEPTTPVPTVPTTPNVPSTPGETCIPGNNVVTVEQDSLILVNLYSDDKGPCRIDNQTQPKNGTLTNVTDGFVTYTPNPGFTGTDTFIVRYKDGNTSIVTVNVVAATTPTGPAIADIGPLLDHGGNPISFNLGALAGLPAGSQVIGVTGFPTTDDIGQATNLSCSASGNCSVIYDVDVGGIGFRKTLPLNVEVRVPGFTPTLIRPANIIIENEA